ncbi:MAG: hypothetical protein ACTH8J_15040, partial [Specibacter sp.]
MALKLPAALKFPAPRERSTASSEPLAAALADSLACRESAHVLVVAGTPVHYWEYAALESPEPGAADAGPGARDGAGAGVRTIVMVHGFRGDHHGLER